jgi:hypothetical protein
MVAQPETARTTAMSMLDRITRISLPQGERHDAASGNFSHPEHLDQQGDLVGGLGDAQRGRLAGAVAVLGGGPSPGEPTTFHAA